MVDGGFNPQRKGVSRIACLSVWLLNTAGQASSGTRRGRSQIIDSEVYTGEQVTRGTRRPTPL
jgi:hypothetical protein